MYESFFFTLTGKATLFAICPYYIFTINLIYLSIPFFFFEKKKFSPFQLLVQQSCMLVINLTVSWWDINISKRGSWRFGLGFIIKVAESWSIISCSVYGAYGHEHQNSWRVSWRAKWIGLVSPLGPSCVGLAPGSSQPDLQGATHKLQVNSFNYLNQSEYCVTFFYFIQGLLSGHSV